ncbi:MAG: SusD/RagB family nutrient-binding outer membrane lipoprotein [Prevotellaceae bacterium]|nr:SusD/RagB family nutrient-binding outer membrane lipoprotein [Prevotellaceae bacterium]
MKGIKNLKYIAVSLLFACATTSCTDWLDVNVDPDTPSSGSALIANQLPWIEHYFLYGLAGADFNTSMTAGVFYSNGGTSAARIAQWNGASTTWKFTVDNFTLRAYQCWFVYCNGLMDVYSKAEAEGAYHYMAAANVIHAMGFMEMADLYGEIPYTDAFGASVSPYYDDGKTVFNGCLKRLDDAIELFQRAQKQGASSFAAGDYWNGGDVNKWIKMCYGLKARYLLRLSKKAEFNPEEILNCLAKALQSNNDNVVGVSYNSADDVAGDFYYADPVEANCHWSWVSNWGTMNTSYTKFYTDLLTDMRGAGIEDPRASKIIPASMTNIKVDNNGQVIANDWLRSQGVDVHGEASRLKNGGSTSIQLPTYATDDVTLTYNFAGEAADKELFLSNLEGKHAYTVDGDNVVVTYQRGSLYVASSDYHYVGDTVYITLLSNAAVNGNPENDCNWYFSGKKGYSAGAVGSTGSYQLRPSSDFELLTYAEMCFIKAEVYMRQNNKAQALTAYKDAIKAHIDMMQAQLQDWQTAAYIRNPDMLPMDAAQITAYLNSPAVCQNESELTMSDIMLQKYLAMGCSLENWNDMRRFNFSAGNIGNFGVVYPGFDRSPMYQGGSEFPGATKTDVTYWPRRWRLPFSLELQYNTDNALAMNQNALKEDVWSYPVWWDCATDEEYYNYLKD